jgi:transposase
MKTILGVDIAKDKFDCCLLLGEQRLTMQLPNQATGFRKLLAWLKKAGAHGPDLQVCMEASGCYGQKLARWLFEKGLAVSVVNPARVKYFALSRLARNKTDRVDAFLIAEFCRTQQTRLWKPLAPDLQSFRSLTRLLAARKKDLARERCRAATADEFVRADARAMVRLLETRVEKIQEQIDARIQQMPDLAARRDLLCSIPCVGKVTAQTVLAELPQGIQSAREAAAYAGLTPRQNDSGQRKGRARMSKTGNKRLRHAFYLPAVSGRKSNDRLKNCAARLEAKGLCKKQIIGACMHLLMRLCFGVLAGGKPYQRGWTGSGARS